MFTALMRGFGQMWNHRALVLIYYGINLLFGLVCLFPLWLMLDRVAGHSLITQLPGGFGNVHFLIEFFGQNGNGAILAGTVSGAVFLSYLLLQLFLGMGVLQVYRGQPGPMSQTFWGAVGYWFWPLVRLVLCSIPLLAVFAAVLFGVHWAFTWYAQEIPMHIKAGILAGLGVICLFLYARVMDYARIYAVTRQERRMIRVCRHGMAFVFRRLFPVCLLALFYTCLAAAFGVACHQLEKMSAGSARQIFLLSLGIGQLYMLLRFALKLSLYGGELNYFERLHAAPTDPEDTTQPPVRRRSSIWESNLELESDIVRDESAEKQPAGAGTPKS